MDQNLPAFNYTDIVSRDPSVLQCLRNTCHNTGFFYLRHPELTTGLLKTMFEQTRNFFALPAAEKNAIHLSLSRHFRGYSILDEEETKGTPDHKETLDLGLESPPSRSEIDHHTLRGPNQWPARCSGFREACESYMEQLCLIGESLVKSLALCLGLQEDTFSRHFIPPHCMLRLIAYPPVEPHSKINQGIGDHTDFGCLTILAQDEVGGLEIRKANGTWIKASPRPDCLVVNLGDMLELWTPITSWRRPIESGVPGGTPPDTPYLSSSNPSSTPWLHLWRRTLFLPLRERILPFLLSTLFFTGSIC